MAQVLTVRDDVFNALYRASAFYDNPAIVASALGAIRKNAQWVARHHAENDATLRQIIACAVVTQRGHVLFVRRSRKTLRLALRLRYSVMIGGHVDENDSDSPDVLEHCVRRELREEFGVAPAVPPRVLGLAVDAEHPVGVQHLGIVYGVTIREDAKVIQRDTSGEFANGSRKKRVELVGWSRVLERADCLDPWSALFIASRSFAAIVGREVRGYGTAQWVLPFEDTAWPGLACRE
jgi:predicted NUDIX family phosphoesterase